MQTFYAMKRVVIIGQAPPMQPTDEPFARTRLFKWLAEIGISKEQALRTFFFTALVDRFPGKSKHGHRPPSEAEILLARPWLIRQLKKWKPDILIPVGSLAICESLCDNDATLATTVGKKFQTIPFGIYDKAVTIIPFPHPSGASSWVHLGDNGKKLSKALKIFSEIMV